MSFNLNKIKDIAVIGGGPCGAGLTKALVGERAFNRIQVFERRPKTGGLWNYTPLKTCTNIKRAVPSIDPSVRIQKVEVKGEKFFESPVYKYLDANVPKDLMAYNGYPFPEDNPLFPTHHQILKYIENYSKDIEELISFNTEVVSVEHNKQTSKWEVISKNLQTEVETVDQFDAVAVATGQYEHPLIPDAEGLAHWNETLPGTIIHAKSYDDPQQFKDIKGEILIVGNSASGADIAYQLSTKLQRTVYKSVRSENLMPAGKDNRIIDVGDLLRFEPETKTVYFKDGKSLSNVDKVIFATGYLKTLPFLKGAETDMITDGQKLHHLYKHLIYYPNPTLAIVGIPRFVLPTRLSETQGCWLSKLWSGRLTLPSEQVMKQYCESLEGKERNHHDLIFPRDVEYSNDLNHEAESVRGDYGYFAVHWDEQQIKIRGGIKEIKEAYLKYHTETGKRAMSLKELEDSGYLAYPEQVESKL
ncbi:hypothetical protein WICPIJ_009297 [Wickerhamomyces pijperi]|uniref:Flavin-containing monooxygenase n=1 Tax=Wickerhamomyces pijperi TaxID=599730 RepID=A0A9P8TEJ8_WICPI|nr:hypothetical protein WICPIJ_009297 [Wickerhamomyces pijperi]